MFIPRRRAVVINKMVGKVENSRGFLMNNVIIKIMMESVMEIARPASTKNGGIGTSINIKIMTIPAAKATSPRMNMPRADLAVMEFEEGELAIEFGQMMLNANHSNWFSGNIEG